jgi:muconolactone delta-isomerase
MTVTLQKPKPDEMTVLLEAAEALRAHDKAKADLRAAEDALKRLCRSYDLAAGVWGFQPHHLRNACQARGLL